MEQHEATMQQAMGDYETQIAHYEQQFLSKNQQVYGLQGKV